MEIQKFSKIFHQSAGVKAVNHQLITPRSSWRALTSKKYGNPEIFKNIKKKGRLELENLFKWPEIWVQKGVRLKIQAYSLAIYYFGEISAFQYFWAVAMWPPLPDEQLTRAWEPKIWKSRNFQKFLLRTKSGVNCHARSIDWQVQEGVKVKNLS